MRSTCSGMSVEQLMGLPVSLALFASMRPEVILLCNDGT
jgi:hypothetical protein